MWKYFLFSKPATVRCLAQNIHSIVKSQRAEWIHVSLPNTLLSYSCHGNKHTRECQTPWIQIRSLFGFAFKKRPHRSEFITTFHTFTVH